MTGDRHQWSRNNLTDMDTIFLILLLAFQLLYNPETDRKNLYKYMIMTGMLWLYIATEDILKMVTL